MYRRQALVLTFSVVAAGVIVTALFGVLDVKYAATVLVVEVPLGIISDFLTSKENQSLPSEVRQTIIQPNSDEARKLSDEEERLRKEYAPVFAAIDSIKTVGSQHEFDRLEANVRVIIAMQMLGRGELTYRNISDEDVLETILLAHLVNKSNFKRSWWER